MQTFDNISDARNAIMDFRADHFADVPEDMRARFRELSASPSPVDQIVGVGEFLYANRERLTDASRALLGGLIAFATPNAWHGLIEDDRGNRIVQAMRRDLGEKAPAGSTFPKPADDPQVKDHYRIDPPAEPGKGDAPVVDVAPAG